MTENKFNEQIHKIVEGTFALSKEREAMLLRLIGEQAEEIANLKILVRHLEKVSNSRIDPPT